MFNGLRASHRGRCGNEAGYVLHPAAKRVIPVPATAARQRRVLWGRHRYRRFNFHDVRCAGLGLRHPYQPSSSAVCAGLTIATPQAQEISYCIWRYCGYIATSNDRPERGSVIVVRSRAKSPP